jgi:hypothetical protein
VFWLISSHVPGTRSAGISFVSSSLSATLFLSGTGIQPVTPAGNYFIGVIATSPNNEIAHQTPIELAVQ